MLLLALLATAVSARVFDSLPAVPKGWREVRPAKPTDPVTLKVALKQQHPEALEQAVIEISTPGHPNYGLHMSKEELRSYTAPAARSVSEVSSWLAEFGIQQEIDNDWITISTTVQTANELLNASFAWYEYEEGGGPKLRTLSYSVPDGVADHVDLVQPTTRFGQLGAKRSTIFDMTIIDEEDVKAKVDVDAAVCGATITPACLKSLYNISYTPEETGNLVGFASYLEEYARYSDLQTFETNYVPSAKGQTFSVTLINGGLNDQVSTDDSGKSWITPGWVSWGAYAKHVNR
jgi:tripeptidyl-peptidase-1